MSDLEDPKKDENAQSDEDQIQAHLECLREDLMHETTTRLHHGSK
jgi:hypothetical protein